MQNLKICGLQVDLVWENPQANFELFDRELQRPIDVDLVVLPEMFTTGFSINIAVDKIPDQTVVQDWMHQHAKRLQAVVTGSTVVQQNGKLYNRLIWMRPDGTFSIYDKRHLFSLAGEEKRFSAGTSILLEEINGWKIRPLICYDLRFPVWCRNNDAYDLMLFVANWPEKRIGHWQQLLRARAIENQAFVLGVNRMGIDGTGMNYNGSSALIEPDGEVYVEIFNEAKTILVELDYQKIHRFRKYLSALNDADQFQIDL
jgi:predicted amidohydrolase